MKKRIAVLATGWLESYIISVLTGIREFFKDKNTDIYFFLSYAYPYEDGFNATGKGEYSVYDLIEYKDYDGVIVLANTLNSNEITENIRRKIIESGIPGVSLELELEGMDFIGTDNYSGMHEAVEHLVKVHGIKDIAYIGGPLDNFESKERYRAFSDVLKENGIKENPDWVILNGNWSHNFGFQSTQKFVVGKSVLPKAIVCVNDDEAFGALASCVNNNINVPNDIKIVGFDNLTSSKEIKPPLTTVDRNWNVLGARAANHIYRKITGEENTEKKLLLSSKVVVRASCGCRYVSDEENYSVIQATRKMFLTFGSVRRKIEDLFIETNDEDILWSKIQSFFSNNIDCKDGIFCFVMNDDYIPRYFMLDFNENRTKVYNDCMRVIVNVNKGTPLDVGIIEKRNLIPSSMITDSSSLFMIVPSHYHDNIQGYLVIKDSLRFIPNRYCYDWSRSFSNILEKFREKRIYTLMNEKLKDMSMKDGMTNLLNRFGYEQLAFKLFEENKSKGNTTFIIFIDINFMKVINDSYGHLHGDLTIKTVAEEIQKTQKEEWLAVRYGGDEFVIMGTDDNDDISAYCKLLSDNIAHKQKELSLPYGISISTGYSLFQPDTDFELEKAINVVDKIMYENKTRIHSEIKDND